MHGRIANLMGGPYPADRQACRDIFGPGFQTIADWREFLNVYLRNGSVESQLTTGTAQQWSVKTFQALYVACWLHHPLEKGTFMINLSGIAPEQITILRDAYQQHLSGRKSSHLSGAGRSAGKGWQFLRGYDELLVQIETIKGVTYLMLKSEGHQISLKGAIPHAMSWVHKSLTGEGAQASQALHAYANLSPDVTARAAENYSKPYEGLLKWLKLSGKMITIREVMFALFKKVKYPPNTGLIYSHFTNQNNLMLGGELRQYVIAARGPGGGRYTGGGAVSAQMLTELSRMADVLVADGATNRDRVFFEVIATPAEIDTSVAYFVAQLDRPMPVFAVG